MTTAPAEGWTDDRVEVLKAAWLDGESCSQIARKLGGVTRNAVIGKISRLGLSGKSGRVRAKPSAPAGIKRSYAKGADEHDHSRRAQRVKAQIAVLTKPAVADVPAPTFTAFDVTETAKTVLDLQPRDCRFPVGGGFGAEQLHCGAPAPAGSVYCPCHRAIAFTAARGMDRDLERGVRWMASR